jgi:cyclopropane-fatty-acyl-phospholipid synthase
MIKTFAADTLLKSLDHLQSGTLELTTPDGKTRVFQGKEKGESANIRLHDWSVVSNMMRKGDIGFAEDYRKGLWESSDLTALTTLGLSNRQAMDRMVTGNNLFRTISKLSYLLRLNTVKGSKKNIHAHYDLGNDFYSLWLDPSMTYSSALFDKNDVDLADAQHRKYDRMIECLNTNSGRMLEVGCGWGGLAERAITKGDYEIKGITLSEQQYDYAQNRLGKNATIALEDYRHQTGKFDNIISIEMFEAVGERYWSTYFGKIKELLAEKGTAVIQTITMNERDFPRYRQGGDFIRSYIFPGGMLPSQSRFNEEAQKAGLKTCNHYNFGLDYARTLETWLANFDAKVEEIKALGYDDGFIRLWRFYLAACASGFKTGRTDVIQVELNHA